MGRLILFKTISKIFRDESAIHDPVDHKLLILKKFNKFFHPILRNGSMLIGIFLAIRLLNNPPKNLLMLSCWVLGIVLCIMVFFARHGLLLNPIKKRYMNLFYLLGIPFGVESKYEKIEKLYINRNHGIYCCYIKFFNGEKHLFDTSRDKDDLIERLLDDNKKLEVHLYDQTINPNAPIRIN